MRWYYYFYLENCLAFENILDANQTVSNRNGSWRPKFKQSFVGDHLLEFGCLHFCKYWTTEEDAICSSQKDGTNHANTPTLELISALVFNMFDKDEPIFGKHKVRSIPSASSFHTKYLHISLNNVLNCWPWKWSCAHPKQHCKTNKSESPQK